MNKGEATTTHSGILSSNTIGGSDFINTDLSTTFQALVGNTTIPTSSLKQMSTTSYVPTANNTSNWQRTTAAVSISEEDRRRYLEELQAQTTLTMIPSMVSILLLAVIGVIGNSLVLYVYSRKFALNGTRVFILMIAAFDLVTNVVVIPGETNHHHHHHHHRHKHHRHPPHHHYKVPCLLASAILVIHFSSFSVHQSSSSTGFCAPTQYRKVCAPFGWQILAKHAKIIAVILVIVSVLCSVPYAIINGRYTRPTPRPGIFGHECTVDDSFQDTIWPLANAAFFIFLFLANCTTIVVLYSLLGRKAFRHARAVGHGTSAADGPSNTDSAAVTSSTTMGKSQAGHAVGDHESDAVKRASSTKTNSYVRISTSKRTVTFSKMRGSKKRSALSESDKDRKQVEIAPPKDDPSAIEYFTDDDMGDKQSEGARVLRSASTPQGEVNLSMVRELTIKLRAVQKQNSREENEQEKREDMNGKNDNDVSHDVCEEKGEKEESEFNINSNRRTSTQETKKNGTKTVQFESDEPVTDGAEERSQNVHIYVDVHGDGEADDIHHFQIGSGTEQQNADDKELLKKENRMSGDTANNNKVEADDFDNRPENSKLGPGLANSDAITSEPDKVDGKEEPMSEFARAMQWVDITYCLKEEQPEEAEARVQEGTEKLSKSNSFSYSRKVSRDNSFLRKNKNFREALSDTLSRARKSKTLRKASSTSALKDVAKRDEASNLPPNTVNEPRFKPKRSLNRTSIMLIIISAVYIIGFLPHLGLLIYFKMNPDEYKALSSVGLAVYNLFLRSYLLNSAANAVIYGFCDLTFRKRCMKAIRGQ
ncbi:cephalotocin receptor 1 [Elysia marginata]|uniref:Cephalotocin receptor 1 n=1 Tax=Elysia marginata TaxID=1093978 RepID=A0AAV4FRB3_9GAST|nr:cephalotocin receptor 1 [Elysia marginata]